MDVKGNLFNLENKHFEAKNGGRFRFRQWFSFHHLEVQVKFRFNRICKPGRFWPVPPKPPNKKHTRCHWGDIKLKILRFPLQTTVSVTSSFQTTLCFSEWKWSLKKHSYIRCGPKNSKWILTHPKFKIANQITANLSKIQPLGHLISCGKGLLSSAASKGSPVNCPNLKWHRSKQKPTKNPKTPLGSGCVLYPPTDVQQNWSTRV